MSNPKESVVDESVADERYVAWMRGIDLVIQGICGCSSSDLADQPYREWFESGMSCREAALDALADDGFPFGDDEGQGD